MIYVIRMDIFRNLKTNEITRLTSCRVLDACGKSYVPVCARCGMKIVWMTLTLMVSPTNSLTLVIALNILYHAAVPKLVKNLLLGCRKRSGLLDTMLRQTSSAFR